jgi:hypothetical protein
MESIELLAKKFWQLGAIPASRVFRLQFAAICCDLRGWGGLEQLFSVILAEGGRSSA